MIKCECYRVSLVTQANCDTVDNNLVDTLMGEEAMEALTSEEQQKFAGIYFGPQKQRLLRRFLTLLLRRLRLQCRTGTPCACRRRERA